uniref:Uncharacterized protein n=1 Tax=Panagrolaimus superbus TaxID=310955 RepID=A0A914ZAH1_9BILA
MNIPVKKQLYADPKMKNCLIIYIAFLSFLITKAADDEMKKNVIKIFPIHPKPNVTKDCTGFALNENYFITSQICAAQKFANIYANITPNKRFSVGWNNNIVVGKFSHPLKLIKNVKISKSVTVNPGKNYELIGFADSNKKTGN